MTANLERLSQEKADLLDKGWSDVPYRLDPDLLERLRGGVDQLVHRTGPEVIFERGTNVVRAVCACHRYEPSFAELIRTAPLVELAEEFVGGPVYLYQSRINVKEARDGGAWGWHQDYAVWHTEDGMQRPAALNYMVLLDEATEDNGTLVFLTGSHLERNITNALPGTSSRSFHAGVGPRIAPADAGLLYAADQSEVDQLADYFPQKPLIGPPGTVFAFDARILHASAANRSDRRRTMALLTYNSVDNVPTRTHRPDYQVERDISPVIKLRVDEPSRPLESSI